jgi:hypothetical protein
MPKHKWSGEVTAPKPHQNPQSGFRQIWVLDVQWSTCPVEVKDQVKDLWWVYEGRNDNFIIKTTLDNLKYDFVDSNVERFDNKIYKWVEVPVKTDLIIQYIKEVEPGLKNDEQFYIHWCW